MGEGEAMGREVERNPVASSVEVSLQLSQAKPRVGVEIHLAVSSMGGPSFIGTNSPQKNSTNIIA